MEYLEYLFGILSVHVEVFDGHGQALVFPVTDDCEPSTVANFTDMYAFLLKDI